MPFFCALNPANGWLLLRVVRLIMLLCCVVVGEDGVVLLSPGLYDFIEES